MLLAHILGVNRTWIMAHPETLLSPIQMQHLNRLLTRLKKGEPLPYVIGRREFFGLIFQVTPDVLIPRPETELLVEEALAWLGARPERRSAADVGTGSGCVAITLAVHIPDLQVSASDLSPAALQIASANAEEHGVASRIHFQQADLLAPPSGPSYDLICANLPYIPTATLHGLQVNKTEPTLALDGGPDGLDLIRRLLLQAPRRLAAGGLLLLEIEANQGLAARQLAQTVFPTARIDILPDLASLDRLLRIFTEH